MSEKDAYSQLHKALMFVHDTKRIDELSQQRLQLDIWLNKHDNFQKSVNLLFNFLNCDLDKDQKISVAIFPKSK